MKKVISFALSIICMAFCFSGCGSTNKLVGVWDEIDGEGILYFAENNTGLSTNVSYTSEFFKYKTENEKLTFLSKNTVETQYIIENNILTITIEDIHYKYKLVELSENEVRSYLADKGIDVSNLPILDDDSVIYGSFSTSEETTSEETSEERSEENVSSENASSETASSEGTSDDDTPSFDDIPESDLTDEEISQSIIGAWKGGDNNMKLVYIFYEDGTGIAGLFPFTYSVNNGIISMTVEAFGQVESGSGKYTVNGDSLYVEDSDGEVHVLKRVDMPDIPELKK